MRPVGLLMIEHRLIEQMIKLMAREILKISEGQSPSVPFLNDAIDFMQNYADTCHHGKEEDILFRALGQKSLSREHQETRNALIRDHVYARGITRELVIEKEKLEKGDAGATHKILHILQGLVEFYPRHIEQEDKNFFLPVMNYFVPQDQSEMLAEFEKFDRKLIHERYKKIVQKREGDALGDKAGEANLANFKET